MSINALDQFYTNPDTAKKCIDLIPDLDSYDCIIEPSAGTGSFSNLLECYAYDLEPKDSDIIQQDWLTFSPSYTYNHLLVVGNPPFGSRSTLAKDFIKKSRSIKAETIAFILPNTFSKITNQSQTLFPNDWRLIVEELLTIEESTFIKDNKSYHVPCSFYVWTKRVGTINLRQTKMLPSDDFTFLSREDMNADFSINGNSGKVKEIFEITNPKAEHYIKAGVKTVEELKIIFNQINWSFLSSVNGGNAWIGQQDILKQYYSFMSNQL